MFQSIIFFILKIFQHFLYLFASESHFFRFWKYFLLVNLHIIICVSQISNKNIRGQDRTLARRPRKKRRNLSVPALSALSSNFTSLVIQDELRSSAYPCVIPEFRKDKSDILICKESPFHIRLSYVRYQHFSCF